MRILIAAYACEPDKGSEPAVGWGWVTTLAETGHEVVAITRANNRPAIEAELTRQPRPGLSFVYHDLPGWARRLKRWARGPGLRAYYLAWCAGARRHARAVIAEGGVDLCHHVTFAQCWTASPLAALGPPLLWGPVGGGEPCPAAFWSGLGWRGALYEAVRAGLRALAPLAPGLRRTVATARPAVAATSDTARWLARVGCREARVATQVGLDAATLGRLGHLSRPAPGAGSDGWRFLMLGELLPHKGGHLALAALSGLAGDWRLDLVGGGPQRGRLVRLARRHGLTDRVQFHGRLPRDRALDHLRSAHLLLAPALHDSGGFAIAEALAAGVPVLCLDRGGPPALVGEGGIVVPADGPRAAIAGMASALARLLAEPARWGALSEAARRRATVLAWPQVVGRVYSGIGDREPTP